MKLLALIYWDIRPVSGVLVHVNPAPARGWKAHTTTVCRCGRHATSTNNPSLHIYEIPHWHWSEWNRRWPGHLVRPTTDSENATFPCQQ